MAKKGAACVARKISECVPKGRTATKQEIAAAHAECGVSKPTTKASQKS